CYGLYVPPYSRYLLDVLALYAYRDRRELDSFPTRRSSDLIVRAKMLDIPVLLGSATPALETLNNAEQGRFRHLRLTHSAVSTQQDRKSTRLNSSHVKISYAVFCLKKKTRLNSRILDVIRQC